ncbi:hypothetical protein Lal_00004555 [Lupinus albus]|nr:hypothetical protein Lal_00004555 [Lupinus albus]
MVIDEYFLLHLPLSKEKLKKHESSFSTMFIEVHVCWVHFVLSFLNDVMHIQYIQFQKEFKDGDLKEKVIQMGYELMRPYFERMLDDLRQKNPRAATWLDNIPKEKWTQSYDEGRRYGHMTTNLAEWVNDVLKGSRALPIMYKQHIID